MKVNHIAVSSRIQVFDGMKRVIDSGAITDSTFRGGRLGVYIFSQEAVTFANLQSRCSGKVVVLLYMLFALSIYSARALSATNALD